MTWMKYKNKKSRAVYIGKHMKCEIHINNTTQNIRSLIYKFIYLKEIFTLPYLKNKN